MNLLTEQRPRTCDCAGHCQSAAAPQGTGLWAALLPVLACAVCPACLTTYAKVFALFGIAFGLTEQTHAVLLIAAISLSLGVSAWRAYRTRKVWPLLIAFAGSALIAAGHLTGASAVLEWSGVLALLASSLSDHARLRKAGQRPVGIRRPTTKVS